MKLNRTVLRNIRLIALFACWIFAAAFEASVIPVSEVTQGIMNVLTFGISIYCMWKNNSFTEEAKAADVFLDMLKENGGLAGLGGDEDKEN